MLRKVCGSFGLAIPGNYVAPEGILIPQELSFTASAFTRSITDRWGMKTDFGSLHEGNVEEGLVRVCLVSGYVLGTIWSKGQFGKYFTDSYMEFLSLDPESACINVLAEGGPKEISDWEVITMNEAFDNALESVFSQAFKGDKAAENEWDFSLPRVFRCAFVFGLCVALSRL